MSLVKFVNNQAPYLNEENLNNNFEYLEQKIDNLMPISGYKNGTPGSVIQSGQIKYFEYGDLVVAYVQDVVFNQNVTETGTIIFSDLPPARETIIFHLYRHSTVESNSTRFRVRIGQDGNIVNHYGSGLTGSNQYYGSIIYLKQ